MDPKTIESVSRQIYQRFPEVKGSKPKVRAYAAEQSLLIFNAKATAANGASINRTVRVVVTPNGKIIKVTTSR